VHLAGNAERLRKIVGAEENDIESVHRDDLVDVLRTSFAFDLKDDRPFVVLAVRVVRTSNVVTRMNVL